MQYTSFQLQYVEFTQATCGERGGGEQRDKEYAREWGDVIVLNS